MITEEVRSFEDLLREVRTPGVCGRCGGCVSFCSAGELNALRFDADGFPEFASEEKCLKCGICYLICPRIRVLDDELKERSSWKEPIGPYHVLRSARTTDPEVARAATDGGVVTSLLLHAFQRGLIDGAVVSRRTGPFSRTPAIATSRQEILAAAGSHFDDAAHLGKIGSSYTSFVPAVRQVGSLYHQGLHRVAMVGTPCQVYSLRKMQVLSVVPSDAVSLVIGLFCMENFSLSGEARGDLEKRIGVSLDNVEKLNIKDDVIMTMTSGATVHVPFSLVDEVARPSCFACPDFAAEFADISCGGLGSPDGYTTVVVRSAEGEDVYNRALEEGLVEEMKFQTEEEAIIHRTTLMARIVSFTRRKRARAATMLEST